MLVFDVSLSCRILYFMNHYIFELNVSVLLLLINADYAVIYQVTF